MSMLFAYMAGGEGGGRLEVLKCFVRGGHIFSTGFAWGGGGSGSIPLLS